MDKEAFSRDRPGKSSNLGEKLNTEGKAKKAAGAKLRSETAAQKAAAEKYGVTIEPQDIRKANRLMYATSVLMLVISCAFRILIWGGIFQ